MNKTLYGLWSEWDIGERYTLFTSREAAKKYAEKLYNDAGLNEDEPFADIWQDLMGIEEYSLHD